ncbi:MAG: GNAT family N-acetyltransferase [Traorella sp.]
MENVTIREMKKEDVFYLYEIFMDKESTKYWLTQCSNEQEVERMMQIEYLSYYRMGLHPPYVITLNQKVIGVCNFNDEFDGIARICFILNKHYEHHGYMTCALRKLIHIGFSDYGYHRIEALVFPQNIKSKKTLERIGFVKEATMSSYLRHQGNLYDIDLYALVRRNENEKGIINEI